MNTPKTPRLKDLKKILNSMTSEQLDREIIYNSRQHSLSGVIAGITKVKADLLWDGMGDLSDIRSRADWKKLGYEKEEIDEMEVEIPKGSLVIEF